MIGLSQTLVGSTLKKKLNMPYLTFKSYNKYDWRNTEQPKSRYTITILVKEK